MPSQPRIFISAVSSELSHARRLVAETLQFMGFEPEWQDIFSTQEGDLRGMLRRRIDECDAVIQLIGFRYGAEPPGEDEQFGRVSYTQYEAHYARKVGKPVRYFLIDENFPTELVEDEEPELHELQSIYRQQIESGDDLYYPTEGKVELENSLLKMRDDLAELRRGLRRWMKGVFAGLGVLLLMTFSLLVGQWSVRAAVERGQAAAEESAALASEARDATVQTREIAKSTEESAKRSEIVARETQDTTQETQIVVEKSYEGIQKIESRDALDFANARLEGAVKAQNRGQQGQVAALEQLVFSGYTYPNNKFRGLWLQNARLAGATFDSSDFMDADLSEADFSKTRLERTSFLFADANETDFQEAQAAGARYEFVVAKNADFAKSKLAYASFVWSDLTGASFRNADCTGVNFSFTNLTGADFTGADVSQAQFCGAILTDVKWTEAVFENTDMSGAVPESPSFTLNQRAELCRSIGWSEGMTIEMDSTVPSTRFSTGLDFRDEYREWFRVPAQVPTSLKIRRGEYPTPRGFTTTYTSNGPDPYWSSARRMRFYRESSFLDIGDRMRRMVNRMTQHGRFLEEMYQKLAPVEGANTEFADWIADMRRNESSVELNEPLPMDRDNVQVIASAFGLIQESSPAHPWDAAARIRLEMEWKENGEAPEFPGGWKRLFPKPPGSIYELPDEIEESYREWTLVRGKRVASATYQVDYSYINEPYENDALLENGLPRYPLKAIQQSNGWQARGMGDAEWSASLLSARWSDTALLPEQETLEYLAAYELVQKAQEETNYKVNYPLSIALRFTVKDARSHPNPENDSSLRDDLVLKIQPQSMTITDRAGRVWQVNSFRVAN